MKSVSQIICTPVFTAALSTIANIWNQPKCPSTDDKENVAHIHTYDGVLLSPKEQEVPL
jgi:hypothetical protein